MGGGGFGNGAPKQWRRVWSCDCARVRRRGGEVQPWNDAGAPGTGGPGLEAQNPTNDQEPGSQGGGAAFGALMGPGDPGSGVEN